MKEFRFTNEHTSSQIADITDLLRKPRLWVPTERDYPNHNDWLGKTEAQLQSNTKRAMVARMGRETIGAIVYQRDPHLNSQLEIRNISVSPDARGRYAGAFMLRNTEIEAVRNDFPGVETITIDTKEANQEMIAFLLSQDYQVADVLDLYGLGAGLDVVLTKSVA